jgi:hypothetical protein
LTSGATARAARRREHTSAGVRSSSTEAASPRDIPVDPVAERAPWWRRHANTVGVATSVVAVVVSSVFSAMQMRQASQLWTDEGPALSMLQIPPADALVELTDAGELNVAPYGIYLVTNRGRMTATIAGALRMSDGEVVGGPACLDSGPIEVNPGQTVPIVFLEERQPAIAGSWIGDQLWVTLATGQEVIADSSAVSDAALATVSEAYAEQADERLEACWGSPIDQD